MPQRAFFVYKAENMHDANSPLLIFLIPCSSVSDIGKKSNYTSTLDCGRKLALMLCTSTGHTSGKNLSTLGYKLSELCYILIVNIIDFICTESANFLLSMHITEGTLCFILIHHTILTFPTLRVIKCFPLKRKSFIIFNSLKGV